MLQGIHEHAGHPLGGAVSHDVTIGGQLRMRVTTMITGNRVTGIDIRAEQIAGSIPDGLLHQLGEMATGS